MATYLIENCDVNTFDELVWKIENTRKHVFTRLEPDRPGVNARYKVENHDKSKYIDIKFYSQFLGIETIYSHSLGVETNLRGHSISRLVEKLATFTKGHLKTLDQNLTAMQSTG